MTGPAAGAAEQARAAARRLAARAGAWVKGLAYLPKWLVLGSVIGVIAGLGAVAFYAALTGSAHFFLGLLAGYQPPAPAGEGGEAGSAGFARPWAIPLVAALGALASGWLVFTWAPEAEGHGTDAAIDAVHRNPRGIRLRAVVVKLVASALTIGSGGSRGLRVPAAVRAAVLPLHSSIGTGGSGGVFGPGMVIGAFTGLAVWRLLVPVVPDVGHSPAPYLVVGMMALFGAIARAPLANMLMVAEMTGNISLIGPALVAVAVASLIVRRFDDSIYRSQLRTRADAAAARVEAKLPLLTTIEVSAAAVPPLVVLRAGDTAAGALAALTAAGVPGAPVTDEDGTYLGTVSRERLTVTGADAVHAAVDPAAATVSSSADLGTGIDALIVAGGQWVTVTDDQRRVTAILSSGDIMRSYRDALRSASVTMPRSSLTATVPGSAGRQGASGP